jgi:hypothetical protein
MFEDDITSPFFKAMIRVASSGINLNLRNSCNSFPPQCYHFSSLDILSQFPFIKQGSVPEGISSSHHTSQPLGITKPPS